MRLFIAGTPDTGLDYLRDLLATSYQLETRHLVHSHELHSVTAATLSTTLPDRLLFHFNGHPDAELLEFLPRHGFQVLTTLRHPLEVLLAQLPSPPPSPVDLNTALLAYATSPRARDSLSLSLQWACIEGALVARHEDLAHDPAGTLRRFHSQLAPSSSIPARPVTSPSLPASPVHDASLAAPFAQLSSDTINAVHTAHRELFAAWNYPSTPSLAPESFSDLLEARLAETRARLARNFSLLKKIAETRASHEAEIARLRHRLHGAGVKQHLYRAWQVLRRNPHYCQTPPSVPPKPLPRLDPSQISGYLDLFIGDLQVRFHQAALADDRGTGRVARALLQEFKTLALTTPSTPVDARPPRRVVHFFSAPHWGPEILPPRSSVVIHDTIPLLTPDYLESQQAIFTQRCLSVIQQAAQLITISQTSANDLSRFFAVPRESLVVIPNGVTPLPPASDFAATAALPALPPAPYLVFVGGGDRHKNIEIVFEALTRPAARGVHLVLIGKNQNLRSAAEVFNLTDRVHFFGYVDDAVMHHLVQHAVAMVFPSLHEGFGLPPIEAALLSVPSLCSRRPAMTEFLAGAALFAEPDSPDEWAQRIHALVTCPALRSAVAARARVAAEALNWSRSARAYVAAFQSIP